MHHHYPPLHYSPSNNTEPDAEVPAKDSSKVGLATAAAAGDMVKSESAVRWLISRFRNNDKISYYYSCGVIPNNITKSPCMIGITFVCGRRSETKR